MKGARRVSASCVSGAKRARHDLILTVGDDEPIAEHDDAAAEPECEGFAEPLAFETGLLLQPLPSHKPDHQNHAASAVSVASSVSSVSSSSSLLPSANDADSGFSLRRAVALLRERRGAAAVAVREHEHVNSTAALRNDDDNRNGGEKDDGDDEEAAALLAEDSALAPEGFFERSAHSLRGAASFAELGLARHLLKAAASQGWTKPSAVQAAVVPLALEGRDLCVSAETGSGKTGAFALPAVERLLLRPPGSNAAIRVLVLVPTRELAEQCERVFEQLTRGTGLRQLAVVGGASIRSQETLLRERPDIVVATPGRLVDMLLNSADVGLEDVEMLVLDEADRLLDMGFIDQITEIVVNHCPRKRQTLLFSATMTEDVNKLAALSLQRPSRIAMPTLDTVVAGLRQEFVRVRSDQEEKLHAMALYLLNGPLYDKQTIVFVGRKKTAHRLMVLILMAGHSCGELQGGMSQSARNTAMAEFRSGKTRVLVATDVASRGLDAKVDAVLNVDMPMTVKEYVHRVGRTARAGRSGLAISLVKEQDRSLVKAIVKEGISDALRRQIPFDRVKFWHEQIVSWKDDLQQLHEAETAEREFELGMRDAAKAHNLVAHQDEILARPKREWFQTEQEKKAAQEKQDAIEAKKREKKLKKKLKKLEEQKKQPQEKKEGWIPEEQMSLIREERRKRAREKEEEKKAARERLLTKDLLEFRDEDEEKRARVKKELAAAARVGEGDGVRSGAKRALVAQQMRYKEEEKSKNAHRHERKEAHKKSSFKSLSKYKRRR